MGRASSKKKSVARAGQLSGKKGSGRNWAWPIGMTVTVVVLTVLVVISAVNRDDDSVPPLVGDHWHAAYGVYNCGQFTAPFGESMSVMPSMHSHTDGLIHIEPGATEFTGPGANLGAFAEGVGLELTDTSMVGDGIRKSNGDKCGAKEGSLRLVVWDNPADETPTEITSDLAEFAPQDQQVMTLAYVPTDAELADVPKPPSMAELASQGGAGPPPSAPSQTVPVDSSTTTIPPSEPAESTTTTAAP